MAKKRQQDARISPDHPAVGILAITVVGLVMAASYAFSFWAVAESAMFTVEDGWVRFLAPVIIDGAILAATIALAVFRWRRESAAFAMFGLVTATAFSLIINFGHAADINDWDFSKHQTWLGTLIGVSAPIFALYTADLATRLVFTPTKPLASKSGKKGDKPSKKSKRKRNRQPEVVVAAERELAVAAERIHATEPVAPVIAPFPEPVAPPLAVEPAPVAPAVVTVPTAHLPIERTAWVTPEAAFGLPHSTT